jgi:prephenate dehydrogenase
MRVAVLGVGLIGGSIGMATRRRAGAHVVGYDPHADALLAAVELGAIDEPAFELRDAVRDADIVFVATPVGSAVQTARLALQQVGAECVVSDVGSTKRAIVNAISDPRFVGGHPLAGAETAGVGNARKDLFDGAVWYLTPLAGAAWSAAGASSPATSTGAANPLAGDSSPGAVTGAAGPPAVGASGSAGRAGPVDSAPWAVERLRGLIERIGARPVAINPDAHDWLMASVSHLPHVFANLLVEIAVSAVEFDDVEAQHGALGAGPSFRDATRVAGANTAIWTDIYLSNRDAVIGTIDDAVERLGEVRRALAHSDGEQLAAWNEHARAARRRLQQAGLAPGS